MKAFRFALSALAALFVAACLPVTTKHPIGTTAGIKSDAALAGIWKGHGDSDDKDGYIVFLNNGDDTMTAIVFSPDDKDGEWETYTLRTAALGATRYLTARGALKNGKPLAANEENPMFPFLYRLGADGTLTLWMMDEAAAKAAIRARKIQGTVDPGDMGDAHITAEPAALDAYFASKQGAGLFTQKLLTLHKLN